MQSIPKLVEPENKTPAQQAIYDLAEAMQYPVDHRGYRYDVKFLIPALSYHLARCGFRLDKSQAVIKARRMPPQPGVIDDAVEWVAPDAPNSIDDELLDATLDDLGRLSPAARAELIRRLGGDGTKVADAEPGLDEHTPWRVETNIRFDKGV